MQRTKSSIIHKIFVLLLTASALFTGTAWLANFRIPLAVLQTIGIVDKVRLDGVDWSWYWNFKDDGQRESSAILTVSKQTLRIGIWRLYSAKQAPVQRLRVRLGGPVVYRTRAVDFLHGNRHRLKDGTPAPRLSLRTVTIDLALWLLWPLFAAYPIWYLVRGPLTLRHRRKHGLCLNCGYSLKQLTEPRCPECGCKMDPATSE